VYGADESGTVASQQLVALLRAMGQTPSFLDMRELQKKLPAAPRLSFQQFLDLYAAERRAWDSMEEVMAQLGSFDHKGDGTLDSSEMVSALTTLGDTLSEAQCADLLALADGKGRINIVVLAKCLLAQ
jgi:Ca2+-binding EF-hand superfamily protein